MKKIIALLSVVLLLSACGEAKNEEKNETTLSGSESQSGVVSQTGSSEEKDAQIINTSASGSTGKSENTKNPSTSGSSINTGTGDTNQIVNDAVKDIENLFGDIEKDVK